MNMTTTTDINNTPQTGSLAGWLVGWIDRPAATFQAVLTRRKWWVWLTPLLIVLAAFAILTAIQAPYSLEMAQEQAEIRLAQLPPEQVEAARAGMEKTMTLPFMTATALGFGVVALLFSLLAQATFLYFGSLVSGGDDMRFGQMFTLSAYTRLPLALSFLAQAGFILITHHLLQQPGLSFLVSTGDLLQDARNPLFVLLGTLDLFWLWHLLLVGIALSAAARLGWAKALLLTLLYAAIWLGATVAPTLIVSWMMP